MSLMEKRRTNEVHENAHAEIWGEREIVALFLREFVDILFVSI